jgi:hypothetical protein
MRGLVVVVVVGASACGGEHHVADAGSDAEVDADEGSGFRVGGTALGIRAPFELVLDAGGARQATQVTEDGAFRFPLRLADGTSFAVTGPCMIAFGT